MKSNASTRRVQGRVAPSYAPWLTIEQSYDAWIVEEASYEAARRAQRNLKARIRRAQAKHAAKMRDRAINRQRRWAAMRRWWRDLGPVTARTEVGAGDWTRDVPARRRVDRVPICEDAASGETGGIDWRVASC